MAHAALDRYRVAAGSAKVMREVFAGLARIDLAAAVEVHGRVLLFGPGMDREMGFGDRNDGRHPTRDEFMRPAMQDLRAGIPGNSAQ